MFPNFPTSSNFPSTLPKSPLPTIAKSNSSEVSLDQGFLQLDSLCSSQEPQPAVFSTARSITLSPPCHKDLLLEDSGSLTVSLSSIQAASHDGTAQCTTLPLHKLDSPRLSLDPECKHRGTVCVLKRNFILSLSFELLLH